MKKAADERLRVALEKTGARDPREEYRELLRELRENDPERYTAAVKHYETQLIPAVAEGRADPLEAWVEYGCLLARSLADGAPAIIDPTGKRLPLQGPTPADALVLHLPTSTSLAARAVRLPPVLSAAQEAAYGLLVRRRVSGAE
jgi:hypothetical protein